MSTISLFYSVGRDLRLTLRRLQLRPAFTFAAVFTLALGIGATTAIFSVVYSVLIKPLPYPKADELVRLRYSAAGINTEDLGSSPTMYFTFRDKSRVFANIGLWQDVVQTLTGLGEPEQLRSLRVTQGTLQALGVQPTRGRWFTEEEHGEAAEGSEPVIISYAFWQRRLGGDEAALGSKLTVDSRPSQIVGIMPPDFRFLDLTPQPDVIVAVRLDPARQVIGAFSFQSLARLKPGVTQGEAYRDLQRMLPTWLDAWPLMPGVALTRDAIANWRITPVVRPLKDDLVAGVAGTLWVLMSAIGAVLLVACANIVNLMLVRADARRREFAVRAALGAAPARIARESLVESLVIGATGGVLGLVLAKAGLQLLVAIGPSSLPRLQNISIYAPVLVFAVAVSLASTLVFGSITALRHTLYIETPAIGGVRGSSLGAESSKMQSALVIAQVALALVVVISAALMIRTFQALHDVNPGFSDAPHVQTARIWIPNLPPAQAVHVQHDILDKIAGLPGVTSTGFASQIPLEGQQNIGPVVVEGQTLSAGNTPPPRRFKFVSPGYFEAIGTRMVAGRDVGWSDIEAGGRVAVISEDFARELAPEPSGAIGKRIRMPFANDAWREVIGVVQSVHEDALSEEPPSFVYWPAFMENFRDRPVVGTPAVAFVIRSERAGTASLVDEVRHAVWSVNGSLPVALERTMQDLYTGSLARTSFALVALAIASAMALTVSVIGIYGVVAFVVSQRAREIGIRSALGATPWQLKRMFVLHGFSLAATGAGLGLLGAAALGRSMSTLLFGIGPMDPAAYAAALGLVVAVASLASYVPARSAAAADPMETLNAE